MSYIGGILTTEVRTFHSSTVRQLIDTWFIAGYDCSCITPNFVQMDINDRFGACRGDVVKLRRDIETLQHTYEEMQYTVLFDRINIARQLSLRCRPYHSLGSIPLRIIEHFIEDLQKTNNCRDDVCLNVNNKKRHLLGADASLAKRVYCPHR